MAGIYRRGKTWWGRVQHQGRDIRQSLETRSESLARRRLKVWLDRLEGAGWGEKAPLNLNALAEQFIREHLPRLRYRSAERYGTSIGHLDRLLGDRDIAVIGSADLVAFETARRSEGVSAPTVRRDMACLSSMYGFAIERELIENNPVTPFLKRAKKRGLRENEPRTRYLSGAEETALVAAAASGRPQSSAPRKPNARRRMAGPRNDMMLQAAIVVAIASGLRKSEQFGLKWSDVDLDRGTVRIPNARAKGKRSREVVLLPPAIAALRTLPRHIKSPFVFWHRDGIRIRHLDRGFKAAGKRAKLSDLTWHDLRRTHGCRLLQEHGWSIEMVQAQLGHASVVVTQKAYAFLEVEHRLQRAGNRATPESPPPAAAQA